MLKFLKNISFVKVLNYSGPLFISLGILLADVPLSFRFISLGIVLIWLATIYVPDSN